jgi:MFS family permease
LRLAVIDLRPLRHRDYRLLFAGQSVSFTGSMITYVALPYQVFQLTGSPLAVGLLGLARLVPLLVTALVGGALADVHDRRRMVRVLEFALATCSAALALNASLGRPQLWLLYALAAVMTGLDGLQRPSLVALTPRLVEKDELPAASALSSLVGSAGMIGGFALGGLLIATVGLPATYGVDVASFAVCILALSRIRATPPPPEAAPLSLHAIAEGLRYAWRRPELLGTYIIDIVAMTFGMPTALMPAIAATHGGPRALGLLYAAPAVGSLLVSATSGWTGRVRRHGLAILAAAGSWGLAITAFGVAGPLPLALALLAAAGAGDMISGLFRMTMWNQTIPDELRGRLASVEMLSYVIGPLLGDVEAGAVASAFGVQASVVSGGLLCMAGVVALALALPAFRRYETSSSDPPPG